MLRKNIYLFGAGKIGRRWAHFFNEYGIKVNGFIDNNLDICGEFCEGVKIFPITVLREEIASKVCITCAFKNEIKAQLLAIGVEDNRIISVEDLLEGIIFEMVQNDSYLYDFPDEFVAGDNYDLLIDLNNGMVLGGVESWTYAMAALWKAQGYNGMYIVGDLYEHTMINETFPSCQLSLYKEQDRIKRINMCIVEIMKHLPCTVICNFQEAFFVASCIIKRHYPDMLRNIAILHNDDLPYYKTYSRWQEYVDCFLVISSRMKEKLKEYGVKENKIQFLQWEIPYEKNWNRKYSVEGDAIQIGYAGRITVVQKRLDFFPQIADILEEKGIDFQLNVVGCGDYWNKLDEILFEKGLRDRVKLLGYIDRKDIPAFWNRQDIMLSCSEWEGHSISQCEAMAAGVVPIITDVSGARDDVADGYNGYVVDVGDIEAIVGRICFLNENRAILRQMGARAHETIVSRQLEYDQEEFWNRLLVRV